MAVTITSAALLSAVPAHAISGGTITDTGAQPYLAKIDVGSGVSCSGALLAPGWVVTSAACFAAVPSQPETPAPGAPREATTATIAGTQTREVDRIVPRDDRDLVLAHLDNPVYGIATPALATTTPSQGQALQVSGYGRTADVWVPDQAHTGEFTVESVSTGTLALQGATAGTSVCKGDAGGPVLRSGAQGVEIVGVASGSYQAGCIGETTEQTGATAARVDDVYEWMAAEVVNLRATAASKHAINLSWTAITTRYQIYGAQTAPVAITPENLLGETAENRFSHTSLPAGQTWYYRVVVLDDTGNPVATSNTVQAESPTATVTDFNGDSVDDIVAFNGGLASVASSDGGQFGATTQWSSTLTGNAATRLSGDFNGDGSSDIVTFGNGPVDVALSNGTGFGAPQRWHDNFGLDWQKMATGDVNGDGMDDILAFSRGDLGDVFVALSDGDRFQIGAQIWHDHFALGTETPATGDFNGDGRDDVVAFTDNGTVWVSLSDGTRFVQSEWQWHPLFAPAPEIPAVGDFNGDGKDDIITFLRGDSGDVYVSLSTGEGFVNDDQRWSDWFSINDEMPGVGDFNGDGKSDVITFTRGGTALVYVARSDGTAFEDGISWHGSFAPGQEYPLPSAQR